MGWQAFHEMSSLLEMVHAAESKVKILPEAVWKFITLLVAIKSM
jgi:hypothetical protein